MEDETKEGVLVLLLWWFWAFMFLGCGLAVIGYYFYDSENITSINQSIGISNITLAYGTYVVEKGKLETLLQKEIINNASWNCYDYMLYYNETLQKYNNETKILDIRPIRYFDVCNDLTLCKNYHTFLVVGGYGQECLLDQQEIKCISIMEI